MKDIGALLAVGLALCVAPANGQQNFDDVQITATHVAGSVHMLEGRGGNIGVSVGSDGMLLVDDQFAPLADKIRKALGRLGQGELKFVLNTHWHSDHTGGNAVFGPEAPIIAHSNVRRRLSTPQKIMGRVVEPAPREALPVITFDDSLSVHFNGEEIRVIHHAGAHTDGDSVIFFSGSNVVHMGDLFFANRFPFVDLDNGGDVEGLARHVGAIIEKLPADVKIIPGHGALSTLDDLKAYHRMLVETIAVVRQRIAAGKSREQVVAEGLPEKWAPWGRSFISTERWLDIVFESLNRPGS